MSPLEIAENLDLADKSLVSDFSAKSSFHCIGFCYCFLTTNLGIATLAYSLLYKLKENSVWFALQTDFYHEKESIATWFCRGPACQPPWLSSRCLGSGSVPGSLALRWKCRLRICQLSPSGWKSGSCLRHKDQRSGLRSDVQTSSWKLIKSPLFKIHWNKKKRFSKHIGFLCYCFS